MSFLSRGSKDWFIEAMTFAMIAKIYDRQGLVANASYFGHRAIYSLAQALLASWFEASEAKLR